MTSKGIRFRRSIDVVSRVIGEETVLLDLRSGRYFGLNATGAAVWESMGIEGATMVSIVQDVVARFQVETSVASKDVEELLTSLESQGLVIREQ